MRQKDMHVSLDHPVRSICPCKAAIRYWIAAADKECTKDGCSHCLVHDIAFDSLKVSIFWNACTFVHCSSQQAYETSLSRLLWRPAFLADVHTVQHLPSCGQLHQQSGGFKIVTCSCRRHICSLAQLKYATGVCSPSEHHNRESP